MAPGSDILSTSWDGGYDTSSGTSFACPYVAGVAALMLSTNPDLTQSQVRSIINSTCYKLPAYGFSGGWNQYVGYGLVNAYAAVKEAWYVNHMASELVIYLENHSLPSRRWYRLVHDDSGEVIWENRDVLLARGDGHVEYVYNFKSGSCTMYVGEYYDPNPSYEYTFEVSRRGHVIIEDNVNGWHSLYYEWNN